MDMHDTEALVQRLTSALAGSDPELRDRAADEVTDIYKGLTGEHVRALAHALVTARVAENDAQCQESQLNALCELKAWYEIDSQILAPLSQIRLSAEQQNQVEYLEELLGAREE
jgi:hypothetical protein